MRRDLIQQIVEEAKDAESDLVVCDRRDTFTVEADDVGEVEVADDYLKVKMRDGKSTVYVEHDSIYKLVVERERARRPGARAGFGASGS